MELMEMARDVLRAAIVERNVSTAMPFLRRTLGQILRMEDCVIELRLGSKNATTVASSLYLTRLMSAIFIPTRLLTDESRGADGVVTRNFLAKYFPRETLPTQMEQQVWKRTGITELIFPENPTYP
jgi:hypothetical protein